LNAVLHARARVDQNGERNRKARAVEEEQFLPRPVLEHDEILLLQIGDIPVLAIDDGHIERDDVDRGAEQVRLLGRFFLRFVRRPFLRRDHGQRRDDGDQREEMPHYFFS
jgi:hypothetical protein